MLKFSADQLNAMETRQYYRVAGRICPAILAEFGQPVLDKVEPLEKLVQASTTVKLDQLQEIYRFVRACCALEAESAIPERRMLIVQFAQMPIPQENRLTRIERTAFSGGGADRWADYLHLI